MLQIITFLSIILIFSSCSRNSNNEEVLPADVPMPKELVGKWKIVSIHESVAMSDSSERPYDSGNIYDIEYKSDGTYLGPNAGNACEKGTFRLSDNFKKLYLKNPCNTKEGFWNVISISDPEMILNIPDFEGTNYRYKKIITSN